MRLIRDGWVDEHGALSALQRRASSIWAEDIEAPQRLERLLWKLSSGRVRVAQGAELVVGFSVMMQRERGDCHLDAVFVDPEGWRRGFGRALVVDAMHLARAEGAETVTVHARGEGERFYAHMGFLGSELGPAATDGARSLRFYLH